MFVCVNVWWRLSFFDQRSANKAVMRPSSSQSQWAVGPHFLTQMRWRRSPFLPWRVLFTRQHAAAALNVSPENTQCLVFDYAGNVWSQLVRTSTCPVFCTSRSTVECTLSHVIRIRFVQESNAYRNNLFVHGNGQFRFELLHSSHLRI